ncbi:13619_t:CDS:2, partial [Cetraspora pellucida]
MNIDTIRTGSIFATFPEARAAIETYAAKTNTVLILGRTTKNPDGSGYRQAYFVCERQGKYSGKEEKHTTKRTGCSFMIGINYRKHSKNFVITKCCLEHCHDICPEATKFSPAIHKFDQDDLGLIEKLCNNGLRTKDIFSVLNSVSSKYVHKPDVYNAISHQRQKKLQGLNEIEVLLKTLQHDENVLGSIATKAIHNDEHDQDGEFIQNKLKKDVKIDEFIQALQKLVYGDISINEESWLAPYMNNNINLDIRSTQRVESLHSKLKDVENRITPIDKLLSIIWWQLQEHSQKLA